MPGILMPRGYVVPKLWVEICRCCRFAAFLKNSTAFSFAGYGSNPEILAFFWHFPGPDPEKHVQISSFAGLNFLKIYKICTV